MINTHNQWIYLGIASLLLYPILMLACFSTSNDKPRRKQTLGVIAILAAAPFFTWLGLFFSLFDDNMCYSDVVSTLVELPAKYAESNQVDALQRFTADTKNLPNYGYETSCEELRAAVKYLANKHNVE